MSKQLALPHVDEPPSASRRANKVSRKASKARRVHLPLLPMQYSSFTPLPGVPKTRGDCPDTRKAPCVYVRCRYHLWREDADTRAGRPGLANVPRGEHGWTLPVQGDVPGVSAGTTLRPVWLELERHCPGWIEVDDDGRMSAINVNEMRWEAMRLQAGERLRVVSEDGGYASSARVNADGAIVLDMPPPFMTVAILITRIRKAHSCALDVADNGVHSNEEVGHEIGRHRTLVAHITKDALVEMKAAGMDMRDLVKEQ